MGTRGPQDNLLSQPVLEQRNRAEVGNICNCLLSFWKLSLDFLSERDLEGRERVGKERRREKSDIFIYYLSIIYRLLSIYHQSSFLIYPSFHPSIHPPDPSIHPYLSIIYLLLIFKFSKETVFVESLEKKRSSLIHNFKTLLLIFLHRSIQSLEFCFCLALRRHMSLIVDIFIH